MRETLKRKQVIGIVGGMGSYATLNFFSRLLAYFPAEREWDRPRIIIDNYCTMPSRVRAIIYKEKYKEVYMALANSIKLLIDGGATDIVLVCNTAHCFLKDIFKLYPEYKNYVIDIIALCARELNRGGVEGNISNCNRRDCTDKYLYRSLAKIWNSGNFAF